MKYLKIFLVCAILFFAERCVLARFEIFSLTPWLGFSFFVAAAASCDNPCEVIAATGVYGVAADLTGGVPTGVQTAVYVLFSVAQYYMCNGIFSKNAVSVAVSTFITMFFAACVFFVLCLRTAALSEAVLPLILPLGAINTVFALAMYFPSRCVFEQRRNRR